MVTGKIRILVSVSALLGSIVFSAAGDRADVPPSFPPVDPLRVDCTAFRPASPRLCYQTANDLHQLFTLILKQFADDDLENAEQETLPTTPIMLPDGTVVRGLEEFGRFAAAFIGSNNFTFGEIEIDFQYRPLNPSIVVAFGMLNFTIEDHQHQETRILSNGQTELFRRNHQMPRGWEQVYEQHAYTQPLLGDQQPPP